MPAGPSGRYLITSSSGGETVRAFIPNPLPPEPPIDVAPVLRERLDEALVALGRLDSVTTLLPDVDLFLYTYIRKEAVLSSQIEGTQSTLSDLLLFEADSAPGAPMDDVTEVSSYVAALEHGLTRIREGFPLSSRLIREVHGVLMRQGRGAEKDPGEFRRTQNWLGGNRPGNALFVPPPPDEVHGCMSQLERFLHDMPHRTSPLLKAALAHVQFETIHPFLDGNGRVGRLLITLILCVEGVLKEPLLYLSLYLKANRARYYELLDGVRSEGDWEGWLEFFAQGVEETASGAVQTVRRLTQLVQDDQARIEGDPRVKNSAMRLHRALARRPVGSAAGYSILTGLSVPTVNTALNTLQSLGVVRELTGRQRNRMFAYDEYLGILSEGTEPLQRDDRG